MLELFWIPLQRDPERTQAHMGGAEKQQEDGQVIKGKEVADNGCVIEPHTTVGKWALYLWENSGV